MALSHELRKEIHKQRKLYLGNTEERKIAKKQADFDIMTKMFPRTRREQEKKEAVISNAVYKIKNNPRVTGIWLI